MSCRIGIDVGGTFTDIVLVDENGDLKIDKVPSTSDDPSIGVIEGIRKVARGRSLKEFLAEVASIVHGTTVCTNTILQQKGAKVGLLTTKGFKDTIEMRRGHREPPRYDLKLPPPKPLVPGRFRRGVEERVNYAGQVVVPLKEEEVEKIARDFRNLGVETVAISFLFSFLRPDHERRAAEIVKNLFPDVYLSLSSDLLAQIREYERSSFTVLNAYVGPVLSKYLTNLTLSLKGLGYEGELMLMQSNGGVVRSSLACQKAVNLVLSGPAAGSAAGVHYSQITSFPNIITIDMGGTSFDVSLIKDGLPVTTNEGSIGRYSISAPILDIHSIGAGGGSIAWIDAGGALQVGPQSAGAKPGPACYGKGGDRPTVTDANLVLGYLNPDFFLAGEIALDAAKAEKAIEEHIARPLRMEVVDAACGIHSVVNHRMSDGIRVVTVQRGHNPKDFALVVAGGAGPLHGARLASELGIPYVIIPRVSGVFCAMGLLMSDLRHDFVRSYICKTRDSDIGKINSLFAEMADEGLGLIELEGVESRDRYVKKSLDMRYLGQVHEVEIELPEGEVRREAISQIDELFHEKHETLYAYCEKEVPTEIINLRVSTVGCVRKPATPLEEYMGEEATVAIKGAREVFFEDCGGFVETVCYSADKLKHGNLLRGPAIVEAAHTTIVVPPDWALKVNEHGDYVMAIRA